MGINFIIAMVLMAVTGLIDGQAFSRAPLIWKEEGTKQILAVITTLAIFNLGLITYIASTYFLHKQGVENAVIITLVWFVMTIVSVAIISGSFFTLSLSDKIIAIAALVLVGLLYFRGIAE